MRPPLPNGLRCEFFESVPSILPQASPVVSWTMVSRTIVELTSLPPPCIEFLGFSPRDGERFPPAPRKVFRQQHELPNMVGVVGNLQIDRPENRERLAPDPYGPAEVLGREGLDRREEKAPSLVPALFEAFARVAGLDDEFRIPVPLLLLPVARQKIGPARPHVARQVLDDERDAVGLLVERGKKVSRPRLREGFIGHLLQASQLADSLLEIFAFFHVQAPSPSPGAGGEGNSPRCMHHNAASAP